VPRHRAAASGRIRLCPLSGAAHDGRFRAAFSRAGRPRWAESGRRVRLPEHRARTASQKGIDIRQRKFTPGLEWLRSCGCYFRAAQRSLTGAKRRGRCAPGTPSA